MEGGKDGDSSSSSSSAVGGGVVDRKEAAAMGSTTTTSSKSSSSSSGYFTSVFSPSSMVTSLLPLNPVLFVRVVVVNFDWNRIIKGSGRIHRRLLCIRNSFNLIGISYVASYSCSVT